MIFLPLDNNRRHNVSEAERHIDDQHLDPLDDNSRERERGRHVTRNNKACLCELVEESQPRTYQGNRMKQNIEYISWGKSVKLRSTSL